MEKQNNEISSYHTFMFPFIFDSKEQENILEHTHWHFKAYEDDYNEITYFHNFFKESMFTKKKNQNSAFYTNNTYKNCDFIIQKSQEYKLLLKSVNLRLFKTGVGILSFHIENTKYYDIKSILEINDYGRRIYAEYLDDNLRCSCLPDYIQVKDIKEAFYVNHHPKEIKLSKIITTFLPEKKITAAVDDRMFVISFYKNKAFSNQLKNNIETNDNWYEYVFVDGDGKSVQNETMQKDLIQKATYPRWQKSGTMYGMSKYSFVCAADSNFALPHMKSMYFQMFSLLLMVRSTILKFSSEVSSIANELDNYEITSAKVSDLYKRYIEFVNSFYFREVTPKDQGIELYEKALSILNIQRDIKDLDAEIEELHHFVEIQTEKKTAKTINFLTYLGGALLPPSLLAGFFGMNTLGEWKFESGAWSLFFIVLSAAIVPCILKCLKFKKGDS